MDRCFWPGCPRDVPANRLFCFRHFSRLPERIRRWAGVTFDRSQMRVKGSACLRAAFACRSWAKAHPDPELPPFVKGDGFTVKGSGLFADVVHTVDTCVLSDQSKWVLIDTEGEQFSAKDVVKAKTPTEC